MVKGFKRSCGKAVTGLSLAAVVLLAPVGCASTTANSSSSSGNSESYTHVSAEEAKNIYDAGDCTLVDVRTQVDYDWKHIPGAILIPYDTVNSPETIQLLPDKNALLLVYCDYGGLSKKAAAQLVELGYTNVVEFDGLEVWEGPVESVEE